MNQILISFYKDAFKSLHCSVCNGKVNIAKPLLLLAMLDLMDYSTQDNRIDISNIIKKYTELQKQYESTTPYQYPIYFLENEEFFHLKWRNTRIKTHTPSAKLIRENVEYAYFDNALWDLLQDKQMRECVKTVITSNFLK